MKLHKIVTGFLQNNTFVISKNNVNILIDPGFEIDKINSWLEENNLVPNVILVTHGHFDHSGGVKYFQEKYNCKVFFGKEDHFYLEDPFGPLNQPETNFGLKLNLDFKYASTKDGEILNFGDIEINTIKTPGHTPGSTCYFFKEINTVFTGDTLFQGTIGRTDFQKGSFQEIKESIKNKLYTLNDDVIVMPGHGKPTTINHEINNNLMVKGK